MVLMWLWFFVFGFVTGGALMSSVWRRYVEGELRGEDPEV